MKKLIALIFAMLLLGAGIASASDFTLTGSYYVRGSWFDNVQSYQPMDDYYSGVWGPNGSVTEAYEALVDAGFHHDRAASVASDSAADYSAIKQGGIGGDSYGNYDHELSVDATWQIDDATKVFLRLEMADETFGSGTINEKNIAANDDNIYVEQVWGAHTFGATGGTLTVGKMSAGAWGTAFHDAGDEAWRIKYVQPTAVGAVIGILHKDDVGESGSSAKDSEDKDDDAYIVAMITKAGPVNVKPLFAYIVKGEESATWLSGPDEDDYVTLELGDVTIMRGMLALDGTFGAVGFEAEFDVFDLDFDKLKEDYTTWGAYLNVWMTMDALKVGILGAYGSYDDDAEAGFDFGDDFEAGGALIMGDDITFHGGNDLTAGTLVAVYMDMAITDQLSFGAYAGYAECNVDDGSPWDGADVWELSADVTYAITPNVTYKVAAGMAEFGWGSNRYEDLKDPDTAYEVYNKLSFSF